MSHENEKWCKIWRGIEFWPEQKRPFSPLQFDVEENIPEHSVERRAYWFVLKIARVLHIFTRRNKMTNTFIIVNINPHVRDNLEDKSMLAHSKKAFHLPSVWPVTECIWALIWKKSLLICFERYQGIPYSHRGRVDRGMWTLC